MGGGRNEYCFGRVNGEVTVQIIMRAEKYTLIGNKLKPAKN